MRQLRIRIWAYLRSKIGVGLFLQSYCFSMSGVEGKQKRFSINPLRNKIFYSDIFSTFSLTTPPMKNKISILIFGCLALTIIANYYFKNRLVFIPCLLIFLEISVYQLFRRERVGLNIFLIFLIVSFVIFLITKEKIIDIPFLSELMI